MRIVFFGTPEFAAHSLEKIVKEGFNVVAVVTAPDKPAGRGRHLKASEVKEMAIQLNLPLLQPTNLKDPEFLNTFNNLHADLGVVIAFRMLPMSVWSAPKLGTINLHASLLPNYRGAAPIQHAIIQGEAVTGVTTFFLKHEIDTGDLIDQEQVTIDENETGGSLHDKLMGVGANLMIQSLHKIEKLGSDVPTVPQKNLENLKFAPKLYRDFCKIDLEKNAQEVINKIRGLSPYPGAWIESPWGEMKIFEAKKWEKSDILNDNTPLFIEHKKIFLRCSDACIEVKSLQIQGKSKMDAKSFVNGLK